MDKSLYNASGCKDRTAHDAICAADRTRTLVYRASRTKKDEEAELFVKMVKRLAKGFGFKQICVRYGMDTEKKVQFVALTKEEIDAMIQQAALAGAQVASDAMMVGQRISEKEKIDRRLHNTDLLLRNYRTLKASYENAVYKSKEGEVTEVLEDIMTMKDDKVIVESIKTSAKRTAIMVQHIDKMLDVYRIYCSKLSEKDKRRYKIIKALYISKTPMTIAEISKKFSVSKVTVYEDIKIAKERLSSLFFGIDGLRFF